MERGLEQREGITSPHEHNYEGSQNCVFCQIVAGKAPAMIIDENSSFIAALDINPRAEGHVVVFSKRHFRYFEEMDINEMAEYAQFIKAIIRKMRRKLAITGYTILSQNGFSSGQTAGHFVTHIIPTYAKKRKIIDLLSTVPVLDVAPALMGVICNTLRE